MAKKNKLNGIEKVPPSLAKPNSVESLPPPLNYQQMPTEALEQELISLRGELNALHDKMGLGHYKNMSVDELTAEVQNVGLDLMSDIDSFEKYRNSQKNQTHAQTPLTKTLP